MGRKKHKLLLQDKVIKVMDIISLMLDCHPVGYLVLCGREEWPSDEEVAEMLRLRSGASEPVHVQGGPDIPLAQRRVEAIDHARQYVGFLDNFGGVPALVEAVKEYRKQCPHDSELLKRIGMAGMPGAKSLEALAGEYNMDMKTLYSTRRKAVQNIAMLTIFGGEAFDLAG